MAFENANDMLSEDEGYFLCFFHIKYSVRTKYFSYICMRNL